MNQRVPTELYLSDRPVTPEAVEYACLLATTQSGGEAIAVAVDPTHVARAAALLFGTGVGIVSAVEAAAASIVSLARLSVATGATEIALPPVVLEGPALSELRAVLGSATAVTVNITSDNANADLDRAERAFVLGADYVSYHPRSVDTAAALQSSNLVALACELQLGGVKIASPHPKEDSHASVLRANRWAMSPGNARRCLPVGAPPTTR